MIWPEALVKVCGLRTAEHALVAAAAGAHCLGVILAPGRRRIEPEAAATIAAAIRAEHPAARLVGVFVNETPGQINHLADQIGLDLVQLSGDEAPAIAGELRRPIIKALRLTGGSAEQMWLERSAAEPERIRLLADAHVPGSFGGAGVRGDWQRAAALAGRRPLILAGGLTPEDVAEAIGAVRPWGVDVSSGVETDGSKDSVKIQAFVMNAIKAFATNRRHS